jgi:dimethylhistidine N-methyltransferase
MLKQDFGYDAPADMPFFPETRVPDPFLRDLTQALAAAPHSLSPKYFYDEAGSRLFDRICELPEYYPTRCEMSVLRACAHDIAKHMGSHTEIVEYGAGSLHKIRPILDELEGPTRYLPIDISGDHLHASARTLREAYPEVSIHPIIGDYTANLNLPAIAKDMKKRVGFFPGSTLGNMHPQEALDFLRMVRVQLRGGALLLGVDLIKDPAVLHAAYNDSQGVTAAFNLNVLVRANRELGADFDLDAFSHSAFYNAPEHRVEMHLMCRKPQEVHLNGRCFRLAQGDTLHTENSYKFTVSGLRTLASEAGFVPSTVWTDPDRMFSLHWLDAPG